MRCNQACAANALWRTATSLAAVFLMLAAGIGESQPPPVGSGLPAPRLFSAIPSGGKAGTTFEVTFTGLDIEEPDALFFSQPGIKAEPIHEPAPAPPPMPQPAAKGRGKKQRPKPIVTRFKVTIAPDTPVGIHDVRLVNKWGVSNPRAFVVGDQTEVVEKEPNNDVPQAQRVEMNTTVNGTIAAPTDVDYFVFSGRKGQRVVVSCLASSIDSRLQAALELYDSAGRQLAFNRHYQNNDALVDSTLPADGDYYVRLYEFTHALGSPEHFYRLSITTAPWIDAIHPAVVEPGKTATLMIYGRNLPGGHPDPAAIAGESVLEKVTVTLNVPSDPAAQSRLTYGGFVSPAASVLDGFEYRVRNASGVSNPFLLTYARAPVVLDNQANGTPQTAQEIALPCEIAGRVQKLRDRDWYAFSAKKGEVYAIEAFSDRLGSPTDIYFALYKADSKQMLAELDDNPEVLQVQFPSQVQFYARSDDPPVYRFTVPADGKYQILVASRDADTHAGPRHYYRVRITREQPDFQLIVMAPDTLRPDGCCLYQGGNENYDVHVWRQDGWTGPITLTAEGLPPGVTCVPQVVGPNLKQTALVVSAVPTAAAWTGAIKIKGSASIDGRTLVREARAASITWPVMQPQGIPAISRMDRTLVLAVRDKAPFTLTATLEKTTLVQGAKVNVKLKLDRHWPDLKAAVQVAAIEPQTHLPANVTFNNNQPVTIAAGKNDGTAVVDVKAAAVPGTYNLVLNAIAQTPYNKDPMAKQKPNINIIQPAAPMSITILPNQVATLSVNNANPTLKIGAQMELVVKVSRLNNYAGAFKVQLVLPPNVKGVAAAETAIAAGQNEAKLSLKAPADAAPGNRANLIVRGIATLENNVTLNHDAKINVNIVK